MRFCVCRKELGKLCSPLSRRKSYANGADPSWLNDWLIVPPKNRIKTTVVAIQNGPYKSGFPSRTSRKFARG